jgi:hypothetical protein
MVSVRLRASWTSDEEILKRVLLQFKTSEDDLSGIKFVLDDSYDIIVFFGYIVGEIKQGAKAYVFPQEPSWSGGHPRYFDYNPNLTVYGYDKALYSRPEVIKESMSYMFYGGRGPTSEGYDHWTYDFITKYNYEKTKNISCIISTLGSDGGDKPSGCLYKKRVKLVDCLVNNANFIDIYARNDESRPNLKGDARYKFDALKDYRFSICCENSREKNYISEKFFDCILTNTVPIYYGCKNVDDLLPTNSFISIDIDDLDGTLTKLKYINENCDALYNEMLPSVIKAKEIYFNEFNVLKIIKKLVY